MSRAIRWWALEVEGAVAEQARLQAPTATCAAARPPGGPRLRPGAYRGRPLHKRARPPAQAAPIGPRTSLSGPTLRHRDAELAELPERKLGCRFKLQACGRPPAGAAVAGAAILGLRHTLAVWARASWGLF